MARPDPEGVRRVAVVGTGLIGSGWAALFLARGFEVWASDPHPDAEARLRAQVDTAWPALERLGLAPGADPANLRFTGEVEAAVAEADFVQESVREDEALKTGLIARIDAGAPEHTIIASSSSGLLPSRIQAACHHPERVLVGHPFNPVYLLPLVEVLGGAHTDPDAVDWTMAFYRAIGKQPLRVRTEIDGYISDRLQEALWREALHLVAEGVATTEEIDAAITGGPGLRWALMGPCLTFHLAGGENGMRHMLDQFGHDFPWARFRAPPLTDALVERMVEGTAAQANGRSIRELELERDERLLAILEITGNRLPGTP